MSHGPLDIVSNSEQETHALGASLPGRFPGCRMIALSGDLGSGKTVLVRGICAAMHCEDQVSSPTFTIVNEYDGDLPLVHVDLYRLNSIHEMLELGLDELFLDERLILVEWAERALPLLPAPRLEILADYAATEQQRRYRIQCFDAGMDSILAAPPGTEVGA